MSVDALLSKLKNVQGKGPRWRSECPAHESKNATRSLSVFEPDPDRILLHCHAGCSVQEIAAKLGIELCDLFPPRVGDYEGRPRIRKPCRSADVINALRGELAVAWVILSDVERGHSHSDEDRARAGVAVDRVKHLMLELENAR